MQLQCLAARVRTQPTSLSTPRSVQITAYIGISLQRTTADEWYIPKIRTFVAYNDMSKTFKVQDGNPLSLTKPNPSLRHLVEFAGVNETNRVDTDLEFWVALHTDDAGTTREVRVSCLVASRFSAQYRVHHDLLCPVSFYTCAGARHESHQPFRHCASTRCYTAKHYPTSATAAHPGRSKSPGISK